jgi:hypothetical protein
MANNHYNHNDWNEFQWENEIRQDEKRISRYFQELPDCIDLPGEEDYIMKKLMGMPDLVPTKADSFLFDFDDDDEGLSSAEWRSRRGADLYEQAVMISLRWNSVLASQLDAAMFRRGLSVTCLFGKLISRTVDMVNTEDNMPGLKISLLKRILHDINALVGLLRSITVSRRNAIANIDIICEQLQSCREKTIDYLQEMKRNQA